MIVSIEQLHSKCDLCERPENWAGWFWAEFLTLREYDGRRRFVTAFVCERCKCQLTEPTRVERPRVPSRVGGARRGAAGRGKVF